MKQQKSPVCYRYPDIIVIGIQCLIDHNVMQKHPMVTTEPEHIGRQVKKQQGKE